MKKIAPFLALAAILFSCKLTDQKQDEETVTKTLTSKDSTVVNDKDENGCLASAGYIWSKVNKECVKVFSGIQLNPVDMPNNQDETLSAYVLFNEDAKLAEVFLPKDTTSIVLTRSGNSKPWLLNDWQLIPSKEGYVLKKANVSRFAGDAIIGKKEINTDTEQ